VQLISPTMTLNMIDISDYFKTMNKLAPIDGDIMTTLLLPTGVNKWWRVDLWGESHPLLRVELYVPSGK